VAAAIIETARLRLHEFVEGSGEDAAFMLELLNDPGFLRYIGDRGVHTLEQSHAYLLKGPISSYRNLGFGLYRIEEKSALRSIGVCGLVKRDTLDDVDLGYALLADSCGQGYAREAAAAVLARARAELPLRRIVAITDPANQASIALLEKLGFVFERRVRLSADDIELKLFALEIEG
jgi:RimJ/RimL family protein N-acetyltransferase